MTQVAVARGNMTSTTPAGNRGSTIELGWREMLDLANELSTVDGFVPKPLLGRPPAILATLLAGQELGLGPMAALRSVYIIDGKATLAAVAARALVYAAGHALDWDGSDTKCVARGRRRDETKWTEVEWTIDRARRAKLADRQAWRLYPRAMLTARATAELCNIKFSDVLMGLDIAELSEDAVADNTTETPKTNRRSRKPQATETPLDAALPSSVMLPPQPPAEPPLLPGESGLEDAETPAPASHVREPELGPHLLEGLPQDTHRGIAQSQLRRLHARMAEVFPNANRQELDLLRHALVLVVTRDRDDGPALSSAQISTAELMGVESRLNYIQAGECLVAIRSDDVVEFRMRGMLYVANVATCTVAATEEM